MALFGLFGKKKKGGGFDFQPYSGLRPPRIDANGKEYLRPTQDLTQKTIMDRAQGIGVGYDPERRNLLTDLVRSQLGQQEEDQLREAQGRIASSGLSGNPRAYEALAGRVKRDTGRQLADSLSKIAIEDLGRANEERDANTARLQRLNETNFGQENNAADFDLSVYGQEQGNRARSAAMDNQMYQYDQSRRDALFSDLGGLATDIGLGFATGGASVPFTTAAKAGTGISPTMTPANFTQPLNKTRAYRNLVR